MVGNSGDLTAFRRAMDSLLGQYGTAAGLAVKYLGGSYMSRVERGQPGEVAPVNPVPAAKQREALDFLSKSVWAADAFAAPAACSRAWRRTAGRSGHGRGHVLRAVGLRLDRQGVRWSRTRCSARCCRSALLDHARSREPHGGSYRLSEHFDRLTRAVWGEVGGPVPGAAKALEGTSTRREIQRAFVDRLANMVTANNGAPDDARALTVSRSRIDARCAPLALRRRHRRRVHLVETRARIKRALEAGREADAARRWAACAGCSVSSTR